MGVVGIQSVEELVQRKRVAHDLCEQALLARWIRIDLKSGQSI